jgi:glycosyltransferase involved in cell wall biosynthesis
VQHARRTNKLAIVYPRGGDIYEVSRFRKKPAAWRKLTSALTQANAVVCASAAMQDLVQQIIAPAPATHLTRIPNGVNIEELNRDATTSRFATDPQYQKPFILALGRTIRRKGFHLLIEAFSKLTHAGLGASSDDPDSSTIHLVIAGDGKDLDNLKQQALPYHDRILFPGLVENQDKRYLLQHCRFMAAPSLEESFGNVALEAMACGKPVIASNASGFAEIVQDHQNGRLVEANNVDVLTTALRDYITRDLTEQSQAAKRTAQAFSWPTIAQKYLDLIDTLQAAKTR